MVTIKICGITDADALVATIASGAQMAGFVFYEPSPRHLQLEDAARLRPLADSRIKKVAVTVDADDERLRDIVNTLQPDVLQLHGRETPARLANLRGLFNVPLLKTIKIVSQADLAQVKAFSKVADDILFDAKAPGDGDLLPGGNGLAFDWTLLEGLARPLPYMLAGGLNCTNVANAIQEVHPAAIDVSSGVERSPGKKDPQMIKKFVETARAAALRVKMKASQS